MAEPVSSVPVLEFLSQTINVIRVAASSTLTWREGAWRSSEDMIVPWDAVHRRHGPVYQRQRGRSRRAFRSGGLSTTRIRRRDHRFYPDPRIDCQGRKRDAPAETGDSFAYDRLHKQKGRPCACVLGVRR